MKKHQNLLLLLLAIIIIFGAFLFSPKNSEYGGTDGSAQEAIGELNDTYEPWFTPIYEPASTEVESLLFTLQGSIGAGIICYVIGYHKGKKTHVSA